MIPNPIFSCLFFNLFPVFFEKIAKNARLKIRRVRLMVWHWFRKPAGAIPYRFKSCTLSFLKSVSYQCPYSLDSVAGADVLAVFKSARRINYGYLYYQYARAQQFCRNFRFYLKSVGGKSQQPQNFAGNDFIASINIGETGTV